MVAPSSMLHGSYLLCGSHSWLQACIFHGEFGVLICSIFFHLANRVFFVPGKDTEHHIYHRNHSVSVQYGGTDSSSPHHPAPGLASFSPAETLNPLHTSSPFFLPSPPAPDTIMLICLYELSTHRRNVIERMTQCLSFCVQLTLPHSFLRVYPRCSTGQSFVAFKAE
jgi:hypothetical protein